MSTTNTNTTNTTTTNNTPAPEQVQDLSALTPEQLSALTPEQVQDVTAGLEDALKDAQSALKDAQSALDKAKEDAHAAREDALKAKKDNAKNKAEKALEALEAQERTEKALEARDAAQEAVYDAEDALEDWKTRTAHLRTLQYFLQALSAPKANYATAVHVALVMVNPRTYTGTDALTRIQADARVFLEAYFPGVSSFNAKGALFDNDTCRGAITLAGILAGLPAVTMEEARAKIK